MAHLAKHAYIIYIQEIIESGHTKLIDHSNWPRNDAFDKSMHQTQVYRLRTAASHFRWHLGYCKEACLPSRRGFDTTYGLYAGRGDQFTHIFGKYKYVYFYHRGQELPCVIIVLCFINKDEMGGQIPRLNKQLLTFVEVTNRCRLKACLPRNWADTIPSHVFWQTDVLSHTF